MRRRFRGIKCRDVQTAIWQRLRLVADQEALRERLRTANELDQVAKKDLVHRFAGEICFALKQGEEYFRAAENVELPTRMNLLYYGSMSLARACYLLKSPIDSLKGRLIQAHHGLKLDRHAAGNLSLGSEPEGILEAMSSTVYTRKRKAAGRFQGRRRRMKSASGSAGLAHNEREPYGTFPAFYSSLEAPSVHVNIHSHEIGSSKMELNVGLPGCDVQGIDTLIGVKINCLNLIKILPDLYYLMEELGLPRGLRPGKYRVDNLPLAKALRGGDASEKRVSNTHQLSVDDLDSEVKRPFLARLKAECPALALEDKGRSIVLTYSRILNLDKDRTTSVAFPTMVDSFDCQKFYVLEPDSFIIEPAALLALQYNLSMFCRYYPYNWIRLLEEHTMIRELLGEVASTCTAKFPKLILEQMTGEYYNFQ